MAKNDLLPTLDAQHPPCPYCGERQGCDEAIPSKPYLGSPGDWVRGKWRPDVRPTYHDTHCRACRERIVWTLTIALVAGRESAASWEKPS